MTARAILAGALVPAAAAAVALPAPASASRVSIARVVVGTSEAPTLVVDGQFAQANRILIDDDPTCQQFPTSCNTFTIRDLGAPLSAEAPHCRQLTANAASCTGAQIGDTRRYNVRLNDGNDQLTITSAYLAAGGTIQGGTGDDAFTLPVRAPDLISGGGGRDTLSYFGRTVGAGVRVDAVDGGSFNDGQANEDRVALDVEQIAATNFDDVVFVPNQSQDVGQARHGLIAGHGGHDNLFGSPFDDTINGGAGTDFMHGGAGDDLLEGRENAMIGQTVAPDELHCGPGAGDTAVMDLRDAQTGCEFLSIAAIDEGGTLAIARRATLRGTRALITLRCPRSSKTRCSGRLTLRRAGRRLGARNYAIAKGRSARVAVRVGRRGRVHATAVEPDSKGRPKTTVAVITVR